MPDLPDAKGYGTYLKAGLCARRMTYPHLAIGLFFLLLSIGWIYRNMGSNQAIASLGLAVMAVVSMKIFHRTDGTGDKGGKFTDRAIPWKQGPEVEGSVGGLLEALPKNYFVINDFVTKKGTMEYIVVGPKGILTIGTKSDKGVVTNDGEKLLSDGQPFEKNFIKQAWAQSDIIQDLLADKGVCSLRPQPVLVFTDADVRVKERVGRVHIIGIKDLHAFLEGLPVWMSERLSKGIIECLWSTQG